ncbi:ISL3 family transposase [Aeribacillus sp. FSL K6-2848]|uniref:ISL3 family transposase n=1 Tax=unclassified Aeribacillus TaxID=2640495 RepID=UPI0030F6CEA2
MYSKFIKLILPLPSFFDITLPTEEEPNVFRATAAPQTITCPICAGATVCHDRSLRRFRHGYAWHIGVLWVELFVPRQRCKECGFTFTFDYGLGLVHSSTEAFRREIVKRCHGRSIAEVAREYGLLYTTVERWFYKYAPEQLVEEEAQHICVDEFALRKGHNYATSVLNAVTGRILAIVPHRDQQAIETVLKKVTGKVRTVMSDFSAAMAGAIQTVYPTAVHVLDRFHLVQFFTDAQQRRRRYLVQAKRHHKARFIDRCLARKPEELTEEERAFVREWLEEDFHSKHIYQALNHMRYVLKVMTRTQAKRRLKDWLKRYQFHPCGVVAKIAKTIIIREKEMIETILSPFSNGIMEGTNNKIKLIKRRGFGYRNDAHLFLRLRLETGH